MNKFLAKIAVPAMLAVPLLGALPLIASAESIGPINFETPTYVVGSISGQDGWSNAVNPAYDQGVVATTTYPSFGAQSLRISDAVTSGSFGDWIFAKPLTDSVGEATATAGTFSTGTKQTHFEMQFDIASTLLDQQPGMHLSVSPDRGDGSRMSYLRFEDGAAGIDVFFDDVQGTSNPANFVETQIASGLSRAIPHTIKLTMDVVDGPSNDVVKVWIDGVLVHTGTSWENYYLYDSEASAEPTPRIVKTVIFQARGTAHPADLGQGYLIDNLSLSSGPTPTSTVKVTIDKFIDGAQATAVSANSSAFPMSATWNASNIGAGTGSYDLSTVGFNSPNPYEAVTADMTSGADYTTNEVTGGSVVGADCSTGQPYALVGYKSGDNLTEAEATATSATAPNFTGLTGDKVVLVLNKMCLTAPVITSPADNTTTTTPGLALVDWTDVTDPAGGITYIYQSSNSSATNPDGSFVSPIYTSGPLTASQISTAGTPDGVYYLQVKAIDADGNISSWSPTVKVTVDNTITPPPPTVATTKAQCMENGWKTVVDSDGNHFKNQGDCVSFVATKGKNKAAGH